MIPAIECRDIAKSFVSKRNLVGRPVRWNHAVKGVTFNVERNETLGLVGESGAGKSTVGRLLLRLIQPDRGSIAIGGTDVLALGSKDLRNFRSHARMIFQDPFSSMDQTKTIGDVIGFPLTLHEGLRGSEREAHVVDLLHRVGMGPHQLDRHPYEFSGGQLQRVAVARAIATNPDVIVCDEPVASLDMSIRAQVINLLRDLQAERGMAYVFISHDLSLVKLIAHRVAVMYRGLIVEVGDAEEIFAEPRHPYTRMLLAAIPEPRPERRHIRYQGTPGAIEDQQDLPGCDYADRCPSVLSVCTSEQPLPRRVGGIEVRCHLHDADSTSVDLVATPVEFRSASTSAADNS
jgi:oligopeptide transport system ATP-binding protein